MVTMQDTKQTPMIVETHYKIGGKWAHICKVIKEDGTVLHYVNDNKASPAEMLLIDRVLGVVSK